MLRNLGVISIFLTASQLLAIVQQCVAEKNTTWMCQNDEVLAFRISDDGKDCHCLFVPQFEPSSLGEGYKEKQGVGVYKFHKVGKTWNEARKICHNEGAHLAVTNSLKEFQVLDQMFQEKYNDIQGADTKGLFYLGVHDIFGKGDWTTVISGQSKWIMSNDSIQIQIKDGKLCDGECDYPPDNENDKLAFFCEKPKQCP